MRRRGKNFLIVVVMVTAVLLFAGLALTDPFHFDLWDHTPALNGNHAVASFELVPCSTVLSGYLDLIAYNDDRYYLRAIQFRLGGDGGAIGTYWIAPGQVRGNGVIGPRQTKHWVYDLSAVMVADGSQSGGYRYVNFIEIINDILASSTSTIEVEAWVTTNASYGPNSWISAFIDLEIDYSTCDSDNDDVPNEDDLCPETTPDSMVNADGCSIDDLCPCDGDWKNHGKYVSCVAHTAQQFLDDELISAEEKGAIVSEAAQSDCGKKK